MAMGHALLLPQLPSHTRRRHIRLSMSSLFMHCLTKPEMVMPLSVLWLTCRMMALINSTSGFCWLARASLLGAGAVLGRVATATTCGGAAKLRKADWVACAASRGAAAATAVGACDRACGGGRGLGDAGRGLCARRTGDSGRCGHRRWLDFGGLGRGQWAVCQIAGAQPVHRAQGGRQTRTHQQHHTEQRRQRRAFFGLGIDRFKNVHAVHQSGAAAKQGGAAFGREVVGCGIRIHGATRWFPRVCIF
jgi:hypothetical protein